MRQYWRYGGAVCLLVLAAQMAWAVKPSGAKVVGSPGDWVSSDDYPPEALRMSASGTTAFRLDIDEAGQVSRCSVTKSSGTDLLDQTTCRVVSARAHFVPAIDKTGKSIVSTYSNSVHWNIPSNEDYPGVSMASCAPGSLDWIKVITPAGCAS